MPKVSKKTTTAKAVKAPVDETSVVDETLTKAQPEATPTKGKKASTKAKKVEETKTVETVDEPEPDAEPEAEDSTEETETGTKSTKLSYLESLQAMKEQIEKQTKQDLALATLLKERIKNYKSQLTTLNAAIKAASKASDKEAKKEAKKKDAGEKTGAKNSGVFKMMPVVNDELIKFIEEYHLIPSSSIRRKTKQEVPCIPELTYNEDGQLVISKSQLQSLWCSAVEHLSLKDTNEEGKSTKFIKYEGSPFQAFLGDKYNDDEEDVTNRLTYTKFFGAMTGLFDTTKPYVEPETAE